MSKAYGGQPPTARATMTGSGRGVEPVALDDVREALAQPLELTAVVCENSRVDAALLEDRARVHEPLDPEQQLIDLVALPCVRPPDPHHLRHRRSFRRTSDSWKQPRLRRR